MGQGLADLRKARGLTQLALANAVGTDPSRVATWERGRSRPNLQFVRPLARALGVSTDEVIDACEEAVRRATSPSEEP